MNSQRRAAARLELRDVSVSFPAPRGRGRVWAVNEVSIEIRSSETLALVGESGCGKSSLARAILQLTRPDAGQVLLHRSGSELASDLTRLRGRSLRSLRRHIQIVFQDSQEALDPRLTAGESAAEPLWSFGLVRRREEARERVADLFDQVGLDPDLRDRHPHELSGGQRQRVGIARALAPEPDLVILDEAISALDVSLRGQVVNLLLELRRRRGLGQLFITHDLAAVRALADRVAVMYLGSLMEVAPGAALFSSPRHPYTQALLEAVPVPDPAIQRTRGFRILAGDPPSPQARPRGCPFASRCAWVEERCREQRPAPRALAPEHWAACHLAG